MSLHYPFPVLVLIVVDVLTPSTSGSRHLREPSSSTLSPSSAPYYPAALVDSEEGWQHKPWSGKLGSDSSSQTHEFLIKSPTPDAACSLSLCFLLSSSPLSRVLHGDSIYIELPQRALTEEEEEKDNSPFLRLPIATARRTASGFYPHRMNQRPPRTSSLAPFDESANTIFRVSMANCWRICSVIGWLLFILIAGNIVAGEAKSDVPFWLHRDSGWVHFDYCLCGSNAKWL